MASVVFLFLFFQTHFANFELDFTTSENLFMEYALRDFETLYLRAY